MGTLLRFLLTLAGMHVRSDSHLSEVSKTIQSIPVPKGTKWFWGGLLHFLPVLAILLLLFWLRGAEITHSSKEIISLLLASTWAWLGPVLIWYYEKMTLPRFARNCRKIIADAGDYRAIRHLVCGNIYDLRFCRFFTPVWMLVVAIAFFGAKNFVDGFGIKGIYDIFWWAIFLGVMLIAYYTSLGFCFSYKAYLLTRAVSYARLDRRIYHVDNVFGLSFIGDFSFTTAAMFFSGWVFAPLDFFSSEQSYSIQYLYSTPAVLLEIFFIFTILSFIVPVYMIHYKILREKAVRSFEFYRVANELATIPSDRISDDHIKTFDFAKKLIVEVQAIPNWPLRLDTALKFSFASIVVPTLAATVTAFLKIKAGAP